MLAQVVVFLVMMMFAGVFWGYIEGFLFWFLGTCLLRWCIHRQMSRKTAVFWNVKISPDVDICSKRWKYITVCLFYKSVFSVRDKL
jgi:hypothetical protein